ncbi:MAG: alpha-ketoglutarate-dependent dioxygenase AlkB [Pseudomonadota bacterium]
MLDGFQHLPDYLTSQHQSDIIKILHTVLHQAPVFIPTMPRTGKPFSVKMSNCGSLGWVSDQTSGYRYQPRHPDTDQPWPKMPEFFLKLWNEITAYPHLPEACLINFYDKSAKMGLHKDCDEQDFSAPVLSISLGDSAIFRIGGKTRKDKAVSLNLHSGDIVVLGGEARFAYHGVTRIRPGTSQLLKRNFPKMFPEGGRLNLTLRRVTKA